MSDEETPQRPLTMPLILEGYGAALTLIAYRNVCVPGGPSIYECPSCFQRADHPMNVEHRPECRFIFAHTIFLRALGEGPVPS